LAGAGPITREIIANGSSTVARQVFFAQPLPLGSGAGFRALRPAADNKAMRQHAAPFLTIPWIPD
jgi:hypothetical protein